MPTSRFGRIAVSVILGLTHAACTAASPFSARDITDVGGGLAREAASPSTCPVLLTNATDDVIEAGYVRLGVESVIAMIPAGHSHDLTVSCRDGRIEAFALSGGGVFDDHVRYRKLARLHASRVTRVDITAADRVP